MRSLLEAMGLHLEQSSTSLTMLWKITRRDGVVQCFNSCGVKLTYDDGEGVQVYKPGVGVLPSSLRSAVGSGVDNMSAMGISSADLGFDDLVNGLYDSAKLSVMFVNFKDLTMGHGILLKGVFGDVTVNQNTFEVQVRSLSQLLMQKVGRVVTPTCTVPFCSPECGLNAASHSYNSTVTRVVDRKNIYATSLSVHAANLFALGRITWTSGSNSGLVSDVKYNDNVGGSGRVQLQLATPRAIQVGDTFSILKGCDKLPNTCIGYNNMVNFRGFPHVPGNDRMLRIITVEETNDSSSWVDSYADVLIDLNTGVSGVWG